MTYDVYICGPVHIDALCSRLPDYVTILPSPEGDEGVTTFEEYRRRIRRRLFHGVNGDISGYSVCDLDPKGFISSVDGRGAWLAHLAAQEFGTYVAYDAEVYAQEGDPPLRPDDARDRWWALQSLWEKQARRADIDVFVADVQSVASGAGSQYVEGSFLYRLAFAGAAALAHEPELLRDGNGEALIARAESVLRSEASGR